MSNIKQEFEELFTKHIDVKRLLKDVFWTDSVGIHFDAYEDYEKYGDAFVRLKHDSPRVQDPLRSEQIHPSHRLEGR
jgi:hypothetical protein